jgi:hypothetical protein
MKNYGVRRTGENNSIINLNQGQQDKFCSLSVRGKSVSGLIYSNNKLYSVEPLGNGLQAISLLDQSKFHHDEHPASFKELERKINKKAPVTGDAPLPATEQNPAVITVLVAYTPKVEAAYSNPNDILTVIDSCIDISNLSYQNSQVFVQLQLVHTVKVDYQESGSFQTDLDRFQGKADGFMDEIHQLRDSKKADICVLLIDNAQSCGLSAAIQAKEDSAFAVVHYGCAKDNLSFPHEIGHLLGARHDPDSDPTIEPDFPWNHGYLSKMGSWRTIMAYYADGKPTRIPYWAVFPFKPHLVQSGTSKPTFLIKRFSHPLTCLPA